MLKQPWPQRGFNDHYKVKLQAINCDSFPFPKEGWMETKMRNTVTQKRNTAFVTQCFKLST